MVFATQLPIKSNINPQTAARTTSSSYGKRVNGQFGSVSGKNYNYSTRRANNNAIPMTGRQRAGIDTTYLQQMQQMKLEQMQMQIDMAKMQQTQSIVMNSLSAAKEAYGLGKDIVGMFNGSKLDAAMSGLGHTKSIGNISNYISAMNNATNSKDLASAISSAEAQLKKIISANAGKTEAGLQQTISNCEQKVSSKKTDISNHKQQKANKEGEAKSYGEKAVAQGKLIGELTNDIALIDGQIAGLQAQGGDTSALQAEKSQKVAQKQEAEHKKAEFEGKKADAEKEAKDLEQTIKTEEAELTTLEQEVKDAKDALDTFKQNEKDKTTLQKQITQAKTKQEKMVENEKNELKKVEKDINKLNEKLGKIDQDKEPDKHAKVQQEIAEKTAEKNRLEGLIGTSATT